MIKKKTNLLPNVKIQMADRTATALVYNIDLRIYDYHTCTKS